MSDPGERPNTLALELLASARLVALREAAAELTQLYAKMDAQDRELLLSLFEARD